LRRILIHIPVETYGEYDIFTKHDNDAFVDVVKNKLGGTCPNVGNRLWFQGIISEISSVENILDYWNPTMAKEYINETFDLIVAPMANIFSTNYIALQEILAERFRGIKIPVYVIACGIQASSYDEIDSICQVLKPSATNFISSVYDTGGEFALRGYFTKEFFDRLGYSSAVVTGCPSLYQLGKTLQIDNNKVTKDDFSPMFNGMLQNYKKHMQDYPNAFFFDQDVFWKEVIDPSFIEDELSKYKLIEKLIRKWGSDITKYLLEDRVKLFPDMNTWRQFIRNTHINCSFGSRIHGNIMPILSGIPAILECRDARTREMAEFFNIPFVNSTDKIKSLYDLYIEIDYSNFNKNFVDHFNKYENFLRKYGIVDNINYNNTFFNEADPLFEKLRVCEGEKEELRQYFIKNKSYWKCYSNVISVKRKFFSILKR